MNFKQFISSVSAFAVASSVFAGLAVTASAYTEVDYSVYETTSTQTFNWTTSDLSNFEEALGKGWGYNCNGTAVHSLTDGVLSFLDSSKGAKYYLSHNNVENENDAKGKVYKYTFTYNTADGDAKDSAIGAHTGAGSTHGNYNNSTATTTATSLGITDNTDTQVTAIFDNIKGQAVYTVGKKTTYVDATKTMTGLYIRPGRNITEKISNVTVSVLNVPVSKVKSVTINYQANGETIKSSEKVDLTEQNLDEGTPYSYAIPTYIIENSKLYKSNAAATNDTNAYGSQSGILSGEDAVINNNTYSDVTDPAYDGYYFTDFNDRVAHAHGVRASMGKISESNSVTVTVPDDGTYDIEIRAGSDNVNGRTLAASSQNGEPITLNSNSITSYFNNVTVTGVKLAKDDVLTLSLPHSNNAIGIDYVLLKKKATVDPTNEEKSDVSVDSQLGDNVNVAAYTFDVTPGNSYNSKVKVTVSGDSVEAQSQTKTLGTTITDNGTVKFGILLSSETLSAEQLKALNVAISFE